MTLTPYQQATLQLIADHGPYHYKSGLGYALIEKMPAEDRKKNPSPQGMALFAGRFVYQLRKMDLVTDGPSGILITPAGRAALG